jgi:hypothetical protein
MSNKIREAFNRIHARIIDGRIASAFSIFKEGYEAGSAGQQPATAAVPDGYALITPEQLEQHTTTAWECPPQSLVVLVSSLKRLHDKNSAAPAPAAQEPVAWQFFQDGRWWNGYDNIPDHRANTEAAGIPTRDLYAAPPDAEHPDWIELGSGPAYVGWMTGEEKERMKATKQPDTVPMLRELLKRIERHYQDGLSINPELEELRALLDKESV